MTSTMMRNGILALMAAGLAMGSSAVLAADDKGDGAKKEAKQAQTQQRQVGRPMPPRPPYARGDWEDYVEALRERRTGRFDARREAMDQWRDARRWWRNPWLQGKREVYDDLAERREWPFEARREAMEDWREARRWWRNPRLQSKRQFYDDLAAQREARALEMEDWMMSRGPYTQGYGWARSFHRGPWGTRYRGWGPYAW